MAPLAASDPTSPSLGELNLVDDFRGGGVGAGDGVFFFFKFSVFTFGVRGFIFVDAAEDAMVVSWTAGSFVTCVHCGSPCRDLISFCCDGVVLRRRAGGLSLCGGMMPGEYEDIEAGVVPRLLQGSGESEYSEDGLLIIGAAGIICDLLNSLATARACSSGINDGDNSAGRGRLSVAGID